MFFGKCVFLDWKNFCQPKNLSMTAKICSSERNLRLAWKKLKIRFNIVWWNGAFFLFFCLEFPLVKKNTNYLENSLCQKFKMVRNIYTTLFYDRFCKNILNWNFRFLFFHKKFDFSFFFVFREKKIRGSK